jgi:hypothetical protein
MKRFLIALLFAVPAFAAGPLEQIRSVSKLPELNLDALKRGEIVGARGQLGSFSTGVYAEACFFVRAPFEAVGEKLMHWDTTKHRELDVSILREYRWPAPLNTFDALMLSSVRKEDRWLIERTWQMASSGDPDNLHVTPGEAADFRNAARSVSPDERDRKVSEFWKKILGARNEAVASAGFKGLPRFSTSNINITTEFKGLMKLAPAIFSHFEPLLRTKPFNGKPSEEIAPYWQQTLVRGHTTIHSGFLSAVKGSASWQVADCTYFTSDTYFMSLTLYELFPIENGTLVWQINFVSAPFRSYLGGTDRFFAANQMVKETAQTIRLFQTDVEQR